MGVPGLWKELAPAAKVHSLTALAVVEGFEANANGSRGFRIGIDASIWTLFFRCANLMRAPFLPLFVFDGPHRPHVKRNKKIHREAHELMDGMKGIAESFGLREAEAELAYLNRIGVLDGILSDDVDNFLFGATTVIRNQSNNLSGNRANPVLNSDGRDDKNHTRVYRLQDITDHPDISFTRGDMIFIGLCSGGDYDTSGMTGCGPSIAKGLVRYGFGRSLYEAAKNLSRDELKSFLHNWRNEIRHELRTDPKGYIGSKRRALASSLPDAFPDIDILLSYVNPLTSERVDRARNNYLELTWQKEPDLAKLASTCQHYFGWGYRDAIIKRFKTVIWHGAVLRILRRGVLDLEEKRRRREFVPSTPTRNGKPGAEGTPSKLITKHFSSMTFNPVEGDDDDRLITRITRMREHAFTDGILEYRLEIRPRQLVLLAESELRKHHRAPPDADPWAGLTDSGTEGGSEEDRRAREEKEVRVWMPACMVRMAEPRLVEEFEQREEAKRLKKAGKGSPVKRKPKVKASGDEQPDAPRVKPSPKNSARKAKSPVVREKNTQAKKKAPPALDSDISSDDELPTFKPSWAAPAKGKHTAGVINDALLAEMVDPFAPDPPARIVRDLTKNKGKAVLKIFFPLTRAMGRISAPLAPVAKPATSQYSTLSAPTPARQVADGRPGPSRANARNLESSDDAPKNSNAENPFPRSFEDRPLPRRWSSITSSDRDSDCDTRLTKSPRKSEKHTSPAQKPSTSRAPSPTPFRAFRVTPAYLPSH
ncbi:hypothetical protein B0H12DRAFT_1204913 [Mycena haematopus]|nr:hypothetical protein B0H12DRAFT_1204913 [Mycena haematopus]